MASRLALMWDAAMRLGPRPVVLAAWGKGPGRWLAARRLRAEQQDLLRPGQDIRPLWEAARWTDLPAEPRAAAEAWMAAHPPFSGPHWQCGQEAALRLLQLALRLAPPLPDWARPIITAHLRRIQANPAYALAQDNNHPVSEAAGLLAGALLLGDPALARRASIRLDRVTARLVAADGSFAQPSPCYHRLMLDVLTAAELLRRRWGGPPAAPGTLGRAAAATRWLAWVACPQTGALPRIGHQDDSAFDGSADARGSIARAAALFGDPGPAPDRWEGGWLRGWQAAGARVLLRRGPLRFRPAHADLLHLELWDGAAPLLRDAGSGAYNPPPESRWWLSYFWSTAAHNTVAFDGEDQMPRLSTFLHAHWPRCGTTADGGADWLEDARGRRHLRQVEAAGRRWLVIDRLSGPYREAALYWHLAPADWRLLPDGVESGRARLRIAGEGEMTVSLEQGWHSPRYGVVEPSPVLVARGRVGGFVTRVELP
ncbi:MAG: heparinase II/III-family protein [Rhodovarius sp.]|nr:heparinase II/III-family protein [Rhodovarius sp.]MCX7933168.1 heparinase II/III-family protein [Rhodovarius sp.]MDW8314181.1 heparinase II/III-family protein [Rhodovarius sp.]